MPPRTRQQAQAEAPADNVASPSTPGVAAALLSMLSFGRGASVTVTPTTDASVHSVAPEAGSANVPQPAQSAQTDGGAGALPALAPSDGTPPATPEPQRRPGPPSSSTSIVGSVKARSAARQALAKRVSARQTADAQAKAVSAALPSAPSQTTESSTVELVDSSAAIRAAEARVAELAKQQADAAAELEEASKAQSELQARLAACATHASAHTETGTGAAAGAPSPGWGAAIAEDQRGDLQDCLRTEGSALYNIVLANALYSIDITTCEDLRVLDCDELVDELGKVGFKLSKVLFKKLKAAASALSKAAAAKPPPKAAAPAVAAANAPTPTLQTERVHKVNSKAKASKSILKQSEIAPETDSDELEAGDEPGDVQVAPTASDDVARGRKATRKALPAFAKTGVLQFVLERMEPSELASTEGMRHVFKSLLKMAEVPLIDDDDFDIIAEQAESLFDSLDVDGLLAKGVLSVSRDGAAGLRMLLRDLLKSKAQHDKACADEKESARLHAQQEKDDEESARYLWETPKGTTKSLEHMRGRHRIQKVVDDPEALKSLEQLYDAINVPHGDQKFLDLNEKLQREHPDLATLLHHEHFPTPQSGAITAFAKKCGLGGLSAALGGAVALPVEVAAWAAAAVHDIQEFWVRAVQKHKLKNKTLEKVDQDRLLKAALFGTFAATGSTTGVFRLSELTNPSDPTSLISKSGTAADARNVLEHIYALALALDAMHPTDFKVHDTMAEVSHACNPDKDSDPVPAIVNAVYGSFLRELAGAWADFQTSSVPMPTTVEAWHSAQEGKSIEQSHRRHLQSVITDMRDRVARAEKEVKDVKAKDKQLEDRVKRLEQARSANHPPTTSPTTTTTGGGGGKSLAVLRDDVFHAKKRADAAKEAAQKAESDGEADLPEKKQASADLAKKVTAAEEALEAAKKKQGK